MKNNDFLPWLWFAPILIFHGCSLPDARYHQMTDEFKQYWYRGEAELSSYDLTQARYGSQHDGQAHLIFVTEDFSRRRHVKVEDQGADRSDVVSVLKTNAIRKFQTGIYDYSLMQSVFTGLEGQPISHPLKLNFSSQEWCGQVYYQLNLRGGQYVLELRSYFGNEGDQDDRITANIPEDAIWNMIRIAPETLPTGKIMMIPGAHFLRLGHIEPNGYPANCTLEAGKELSIYRITYTTLGRVLEIRFENAFPYRIEGWTESSATGTGEDAVITTALRINTIRLDYWNTQQPEDEVWRDKLDKIDFAE